MLARSPDLDRTGSERPVEVQKTFDLHASHPLELELRLDVFSEALRARGGRVLDVTRKSGTAGPCAAVLYRLPLPARRASRPSGAPLA